MFQIDVQFKDWASRYEYKTEYSDNWKQALGAFIIYVANDDCICCEVTFDGKTVLEYSAPVI